MMSQDQAKDLQQDEFFFRIVVPQENEHSGFAGLMKLSSELPATCKTKAIKEGNPNSKIYCISRNHSDYLHIETRLGVKTEIM